MKKSILLFLLIVTGCASNQGNGHVSNVVGIPILMALTSSAIQVDETRAMTAAHAGGMGPVIQWHPFRDAMLYESRGVAVVVAPETATIGQTVIARGTGLFGEPLQHETTVTHSRAWVCEWAIDYDPVRHGSDEGKCTSRDYGYSYGFMIKAGPIGTGWSGGGVYDLEGRLLGMIVQVGDEDFSGETVVFAYHAQDVLKEFELLNTLPDHKVADLSRQRKP